MFKRLVILVASVALGSGVGLHQPALAQTCTVGCGSRQVQFVPGQRIRLEMINRTASLVQVEKVFGTDSVPLLPGQELQIDYNTSTTPNLSVVFWDATALSLRAVLARPSQDTLRIELLPGGAFGDRSVYILNDGYVAIY